MRSSSRNRASGPGRSRSPPMQRRDPPPPRGRSRSPPRNNHPESRGGHTVWVGGLPHDIKEDEIRSVFERYGRLTDIRMKVPQENMRDPGARPGPPFAFVEFERFDDADASVKAMEQQNDVFGPDCPIKVSMSTSVESKGGKRGSKGYGKGGYGRGDSRGRGGYGYDRRGDYGRGGRRGDYYRRDDRDRYDDRRGGKGYKPSAVPQGRFKITLEHIPGDMSWTELKEMGKQYASLGDVTFARTFRSGNISCGILEFKERDDADAVVNKLHNKKIKGHDARLIVTHGAN